jgi:hypothetical protein
MAAKVKACDAAASGNGKVREALRPYHRKRVTVRGVLDEFGDWKDYRTCREIGRACIRSPKIDHEVVASHVRVLGTLHWLPHKNALGSQVEFSAVVQDYPDESAGGTNFCLAAPGDFKVLHGVALRIPDAPREPAETAPRCCVVAAPVQEAKDPMGKLRQAKRFVKACGGFEQAARVFEALTVVDMPLDELREWVGALGEE